MDQPVLAAQVRKSKGKGAARRLRRDNKVPAIFYGPKTEPVMLAVDYPELNRIMKHSSGDNVIIDLQFQSDHGAETRKVMLKELLLDPIKDTCLHADFYEISMDKEITVNIPIRLINTPEGVALGGVLQHIRRELTISCLPSNLVDFFELDVESLQIGDSLHIRDIEIPEGITSLDEDHLTVAIVAAPTVVEEEEEEEEEEGVEGVEGEEGTPEEGTAAPETETAE
ncbi:MAG: 50S ribosomal protein L25 [Deltaproteobacteria bacterium]|nr:50S ribosomal protein L25 [Deltaproteobacteria bacterium]